MKDIELLPHNEVAYERLINTLKDHNMVSINHATGTGKSFIMLKYLYQNRDKRILYLAPTYAILEQFTEEHTEELGIGESEFNKLDTMIYKTLLGTDIERLADSYDIIVLDEYHRCGAKKWGIQVKKLIDTIKEKYPEKIVIGTTATEIRYLDNERNMNKILFDGVEASRLTLADAILQGILPAPIYVNFYYFLIDEVDKLIERIQKYTFYEGQYGEELRTLIGFKQDIEEKLVELSTDREYIGENGKYLVFSSSIKNIEKDKKMVEMLLPKIDKSYSVHSNKSKEANKKNLKEFRNNPKDITSVLYSVNLLNEGVHVKDVDALFLLRPTTSPIIYFQQLGRLLSYSRRKDQVVVFDLVNNVSKNKVIYDLYTDIVTKAKEYIEKDPDNKERYENIIERFKIVDITGQLCKRLAVFTNKLTKEELIEKRLQVAVDILLGERKANDVELFQAEIDLFKYDKYITLEMFKKIKKIDSIGKPDIFSFSEEEFEKRLNGERNINRVLKREIEKSTNYIKKYIENNNKVPSIFSSDKDEKEIATFLFENYDDLKRNIKELILNNLNGLSSLERITYIGSILNIDDIRTLTKEVYDALNIPCTISLKVLNYLRTVLPASVYSDISIKNNQIIENSVDYNLECMLDNKKAKKDKISPASTYFCKNEIIRATKKYMEEIKNCNIDEYVFNIFKDIYDFILRYKKDIDFYDNSNLDLKTKDLERELFCKKIIFFRKLKEKGYIGKIEELLIKTKVDIEKAARQQKLEEYIKFIEEHDGEPPVYSSEDKDESSLAYFIANNEDSLNSDQLLLLGEVREKYNIKKIEFINRYLEFFRKNRRKPIANSLEEERNLITSYNRWYPFFTKGEKARINKEISSVSKSEQLSNSYADFLRRRGM